LATIYCCRFGLGWRGFGRSRKVLAAAREFARADPSEQAGCLFISFVTLAIRSLRRVVERVR